MNPKDMIPGEQFFRGVVREPEGSGEKIVVGKAIKALAERMATKEAERLNWDWYVEHCRVDGDGAEQHVTIIEQWSSLAGYELLEEGLPVGGVFDKQAETAA